MKQLSERGYIPLLPVILVLSLLRKVKKYRGLAVLFIGIVVMAGCWRTYYDVRTAKELNMVDFQKLYAQEKVFVGHFSDTLLRLGDAHAEEENIIAIPLALPNEWRAQTNPSLEKSNTFKRKKEPSTLLQVHLYTSQPYDSFMENERLKIPKTAFNRVDVYEKNKEKTSNNTILSILAVVAIVAGAATVSLAIALLIACNCPQVYIQEGDQFKFKSGLYSGAIFSSMERSDYLLLNMENIPGDTFNIKIENVTGEKQFINRMQMLAVHHPEGTHVLTDRHGRVFTCGLPVNPLSARSESGIDHINQVLLKDSRNVDFDDVGNSQSSSIQLEFPSSMAGRKARLILNASNTLWSGYLYKEFQAMFGNRYAEWIKKQDKKPGKETEKWIVDQSLPLKVYVQKPNGEWQYADYFQMTGNTAKRELIMEIDIPPTPFQTFHIRLETVFRFWEIDYAALDHSAQQEVTTTLLNPILAELSTGENVMKDVVTCDNDYTILAEKTSLQLKFLQSDNKVDQTSYFLVGTGYYHQSSTAKNKADVGGLMRMKKPGAFQGYSIEKYNEFNRMLASAREQGLKIGKGMEEEVR